MGLKIRLLFWLLTLVCFGYDFYLWGGLKDTPGVGKELMKEAPFQSPLAATYMVIGEKINGTIGQTEEAKAYVARTFPELIAHPNQYLVVNRFLAAQPPWGSAAYYLAPILLVLSFIAHAMRQKTIRSLGGVD